MNLMDETIKALSKPPRRKDMKYTEGPWTIEVPC
ncbi:hypothetical protein LCGC14_2626550, partial [marine sediment metagenome]